MRKEAEAVAELVAAAEAATDLVAVTIETTRYRKSRDRVRESG
jgi:hypothetical protein